MALVIETGSVVTGADSFISYADAKSLADKLDMPFTVEETEGEPILRAAYDYLVQEYEEAVQGLRVSKDQTGIFPRKKVSTFGFDIGIDEIPQTLINAQVAAASDIYQGNSPYQASDGKEVASEQVSVLSTSYFQSGSDGAQGELTLAYRYMKPLLENSLEGAGFNVWRG